MKREPKFRWDAEKGIATCTLFDGAHAFVGSATCAEDDFDMKSEKTGCQIALWRAEIKYYLHLRDNELKPAVRTLNHTYSMLTTSPKFNPESYEGQAILKELHKKESDLKIINTMLNDKKHSLNNFIAEKDKFYKHIRANRNKE